jgi:hypothetical protein
MEVVEEAAVTVVIGEGKAEETRPEAKEETVAKVTVVVEAVEEEAPKVEKEVEREEVVVVEEEVVVLEQWTKEGSSNAGRGGNERQWQGSC